MEAEKRQEYYKAIIGPKNQDYYLEQFMQIDDAGKPVISWHWPAFLVTFWWLLYRKMWLPALGYFFLPYAFMIALGIVSAIMPSLGGFIMGMGYIAYLVAIFIVVPLYANYLYYHHCRRKIAEVSKGGKDELYQLGELTGKGGTSGIALIIIVIVSLVAVLGILAAIAIPAYSQYVTRAQTTVAYKVGSNAAQKVGDFYEQRHQLPISLSEAGYSEPMPAAVREITMNPRNGVISITMDKGQVRGMSLLMVPSEDAQNKVKWTCVSEEIPAGMLPQQCQKR